MAFRINKKRDRMEKIRASELRINNWIKDGNDFEQITIDHLSCLNSGRCEFDPIQLTEEWLLKFGFEKADKIYFIEFNVYSMTIKEYEKGRYILNPETHFNYVDIKYVHQLQNLYFALTGEELEINN